MRHVSAASGCWTRSTVTRVARPTAARQQQSSPSLSLNGTGCRLCRISSTTQRSSSSFARQTHNAHRPSCQTEVIRPFLYRTFARYEVHPTAGGDDGAGAVFSARQQAGVVAVSDERRETSNGVTTTSPSSENNNSTDSVRKDEQNHPLGWNAMSAENDSTIASTINHILRTLDGMDKSKHIRRDYQRELQRERTRALQKNAMLLTRGSSNCNGSTSSALSRNNEVGALADTMVLSSDDDAHETSLAQEDFPRVLALLQSMRFDDWAAYDRCVTQDDTVDKRDTAQSADETKALLPDVLETDSRVSWSTIDYNRILMRMAISPGPSKEILLDKIMQLYSQMVQQQPKNHRVETDTNWSETYSIVLLVLCERFGAFWTAENVVSDMLKSGQNGMDWKHHPRVTEAAIRTCKHNRSTALLQKLLDKGLPDSIHASAFSDMLHVYKFHNDRAGALKVLAMALENNSRVSSHSLDSVFLDAIQWPDRYRNGNVQNNISALSDVLSMLSNEPLYKPGFGVWKALIAAIASGAQGDESRWFVALRAFEALAVAIPSYFPDHTMMKHGTTAGAVTGNAPLVANLIVRSLYRRQRSGTLFHDLLRAAEVCIRANDAQALSDILAATAKIQLSKAEFHHLRMLALRGYAHMGQFELAEREFCILKENHLHVSEEAYGSLLFAYAISNNLNKAFALWKKIEVGTESVSPGSLCYDGFILACVKARRYDDILAVNDRMKQNSIAKGPLACHGILLAVSRTGGLEEIKDLLNDFVQSHAEVNLACVLLAARSLVTHDGRSVESLREHLRAVAESDVEELHLPSMDLLKSLRVAEIEEERRISNVLSREIIQNRRTAVWQMVLKDMLKYEIEAEKKAQLQKSEICCTLANRASSVLTIRSLQIKRPENGVPT